MNKPLLFMERTFRYRVLKRGYELTRQSGNNPPFLTRLDAGANVKIRVQISSLKVSTREVLLMYAIMGATGNVGGKTADLLLSKGEKVRVIGRSEERLKQFSDRGAEIAAGDASDTAFLTGAFTGADAVFTIIPPNMTAPDLRGFQNEIGESIATAIRNAGVKHIVNLSSLGAELPEGTGPIKGLHDQEQRLNALAGVNILHLRPAYFMENLLWNIDMIISKGIMGGALRGDLTMAAIATKDIAMVAADHLVKRSFSGKPAKVLLGQRDLTMDEAARIIGRKIGKPDLKYVTFSYDDAYRGLLDTGVSKDVSRLFVEMIKGMNDGLFGINRTPRTSENTTGTPFEEFADYFVTVYNAKTKLAA
jgi:uncharacterized protein YbjT (DUF2867 family)